MNGSFQAEDCHRNDDSAEFRLLEDSRAVMRRDLDNHPIPKWELISPKLGVDSSFLSKWTQRDSRKDFFPLFRLVRWTKVVGPGLLKWVAGQCGFEIIPKHAHLDAPEPTALISLFAVKSGKAIGLTIDHIASQGIWDEGERQTDLHTWMQIQSTVDGIVDGIRESLRRAS